MGWRSRKVIKEICAVDYEFQYDNDAGFPSPIYSVTVRGTSRKPPAMPAGTYYWHVRAKDALGNLGPWSDTFIITITSPLSGMSSQILHELIKTSTENFLRKFLL